MKRLLVLSPGFAPANTPDSHRVRLSLPHWRTLGWEVEVLSVEGSDVDAPQEPELLQTVPADIAVHRVRAWPRRLAGLMGVGSLGRRACRALRLAGSRLLARSHYDLVFISTSQFGVFALGPYWKRTTGVPYVLDFQDPWVTDYYERPGSPPPPGGWKYLLARRQARRAEPVCVRSAAGIVSVSPDYLRDFFTRYPWLDHRRVCEIPFSAADGDLARLQAESPSRLPDLASGVKHVVAVGAVGPYMRRSLAGLFGATARLHPQSVQFHFIGTSYAPATDSPVQSLARTTGVAGCVEERPARIAYLDALRWMLAGDALLILGSDDRGYVPSRLANALWTEKPILAVAQPESSLARRLSDWASIDVLAPEDHDGIIDWLRGLASDPRLVAPPSSAGQRERYSSAAMTLNLARCFDNWIALTSG